MMNRPTNEARIVATFTPDDSEPDRKVVIRGLYWAEDDTVGGYSGDGVEYSIPWGWVEKFTQA